MYPYRNKPMKTGMLEGLPYLHINNQAHVVQEWLDEIKKYAMQHYVMGLDDIFLPDGAFPYFEEPEDLGNSEMKNVMLVEVWKRRYMQFMDRTSRLEEDKCKLFGVMIGQMSRESVDKIKQTDRGLEKMIKTKGGFLGSKKYQPEDDTEIYLARLLKKAIKKPYFMIINPCGEISVALFGAFCVIGDLVPFHAETLEEAEDAAKAIVRSLIRVNTMDSIYKHEVSRTNRIGVGLTGVQEFAWKFFKYGFRDLIDEKKSKDFWMTLSKIKRAIQKEAERYSILLGLEIPDTDTTIKPAGCNSLTNKIKTNIGNITFASLFNDVFDIDVENMVEGSWFEPNKSVFVNDLTNKKREITKLYCNGVSEVYEIEFEDGEKYKFTGNHKLLTSNRGWVRTDNLLETDNVISF